MLGWLLKYVRRVDVMGVGIEFRDPTLTASPTQNSSSMVPDVAALSKASTAMSNSPLRPASVPDLAAAREAFLIAVAGYAGSAVQVEYAIILDGLIDWSKRQGAALVFKPHSGSQALVKFCLPGIETHLWSAWPRKADGAKLHVLTDPHPRFPESLRELARRELARLDGRHAADGELPVVSFNRLRSAEARRDLDALLSHLLAEVHNYS